MTDLNKRFRQKLYALIGVSGLIMIAVIGLLFIDTEQDELTVTGSSIVTVEASSSPALQQASIDSHSSKLEGSVSYSVPKGNQNNLSVTLEVSDGVISSVTTEHSVSDKESNEYTDDFDKGVTKAVVGKPLSGLSKSVINGASLTSAAFFGVLEQL